MELPNDAPNFPKWPFLLGDALLLLTAGFLALNSGSPLPPGAVYGITACVALGAVLAVVPFIIDYSRRQDALLDDRQSALEALVKTTRNAVEQASIAAAGLHEIAELAQKNLRTAEHLPQKLQERIHEFTRTQDEALQQEVEALQQEVNTLRASEAEKLEAAAEQIRKAGLELAKLDARIRDHATTYQDAAAQAEQRLASAVSSAVAAVEQRLAELRALPVTAPSPPEPAAGPEAAAPVRLLREEAAPAPAPAPAPMPPAECPSVPSPDRPPDPPAPARKPASKRRTIDTAPPQFPPGLLNDAAPLETPSDVASLNGDPATQHTAAPAVAAAPEVSAPDAAPSSDGATRLVVTAYIGIGNKLHVRGDGPGLSWDRGVPLQFVSIGKWRWETRDLSQPVTLKLYKNDQQECVALGELELQPGDQREVSATF